MNVKSLFGAQRTRDKGRSAIKKEDRVILTYFEKFSKWLDNWEASGGSGLSRQTFNAARQTTKVFVLLANYLLDEKDLDYVLLGHILSDYLESRLTSTQ